MRLLERIRQHLHFHESEAAKYRTTIELIEEVTGPQLKSARDRKINGAMRVHLATRSNGDTAPESEIRAITLELPETKKRKKKTATDGKYGHYVPPAGYVKHAKAAMTLEAAILKALAAGPLAQPIIAKRVDELRGTPTNRNSLNVSCAKLANDGKLANGKEKKGVYALPRHKARIPAVEAKTRTGSATEHLHRRKGIH